MKKLPWVIIAAALAVTLLYLSFRRIDLDTFKEAIVSSDWTFLLMSSIAGAMMPLCRSLRWRQTVQPFYPSVGVSDSILTNYAGYLVNMAVPFTHEATRCVLMHRRAKGATSYDRLIGVAIVERVCDAVCILLLFIVTAALSSGRYVSFLRERFSSDSAPESRVWTAVIAATVLIVIAAAAMLVRKHRYDTRICRKICGFFSGIGVGLKSVTELKMPWAYVLETALLWSIYWLQLYLGVRAMPSLASVSPADCIMLTFTVAISSLVPVPGGFGTFHFMVAKALSSLCDIPWNDGLAYATLLHESQALMLIVFGSVSALSLKMTARRE